MTSYFVSPCDVLSPRGNQHFGSSAGDYGTTLMPPRPSLFAGAFRSFIASQHPQCLAAVEKGEKPASTDLADVLGSAVAPGSFRITGLSAARETANGVELLHPLPADMTAFESDGALAFFRMKPCQRPSNAILPAVLPLIPFLAAPQRKPRTDIWLTEKGWARAIEERIPESSETVFSRNLWYRERRLGIGIDGQSRTAEDGKLFTSDVVAFGKGIGFLLEIEGTADLLPSTGMLRLGGDGRGAFFRAITRKSIPLPLDRIKTLGTFRLVLLSPAVFQHGWIPDSCAQEGEDLILRGKDFSARLVCAAIPSSEIVSGWDMVLGRPKNAQRAVPQGAVYWFDRLTGSADSLAAWISGGLWDGISKSQRMIEGFNRAQLAVWTNDSPGHPSFDYKKGAEHV